MNTGSFRYQFHTPFVLKLNSTATALVTYRQLLADGGCGSSYGANVTAATVSPSGSIYFVGYEEYAQDCFPPTSGANQSGPGFVVKLNSSLSQLYVARLDRPQG